MLESSLIQAEWQWNANDNENLYDNMIMMATIATMMVNVHNDDGDDDNNDSNIDNKTKA